MALQMCNGAIKKNSQKIFSGIFRYAVPLASGSGNSPARILTCPAGKLKSGHGLAERFVRDGVAGRSWNELKGQIYLGDSGRT